MEKWVVSAKKADFNKIAGRFHIDPVIARVIRNREITREEDVECYLNAGLDQTYAPWLLKDMKKTIAVLRENIAQHKKIRIIGDYDIDGVCASYILLQGLKRVGAGVDADIPDRIKDGYGISEELINIAMEDGIDTILTCDNGISAAQQIMFAKELGMCVLVTDHHEVPYEESNGIQKECLPPADAIVNQKQRECTYPYKNLCGAAVAYKVVQALYEIYKIAEDELHVLLPFVAIATVGDVMDLTGENRIFVKEGLKRLQDTTHPGLRALITVNNLEEKKLTAYHIGFVLGPCINAGGRLSTAKRSLQLFLCREKEAAGELAGDLKALNDRRKEMTEQGTKAAVEMIESTTLKEDRVLVIDLPNCHESLAGIIAGRIRERYYRPVLVITRGEEEAKGSGRSIEGYHMFQELTAIKELLLKYGGHPMAAGLSIKIEDIETLRRELNARCTLTTEEMTPKIVIDVPMPFSYISKELVTQLLLLEPFGKGNAKPVFAQKDIMIMGCRIFGKNRNVVKMQVTGGNGYSMDAIYFGEGEKFVETIAQKTRWAILYYPTIDTYMGKENLQLVIQNFQ